jgi:hypothetical protein
VAEARAAAQAALDAATAPEEADDTMLVVAAAAGFFLCMLCGGALPQWGVDAQLVMIGGMATLLALVALSLLVHCVRPRTFGEGAFTPLVAFVVTGCIGTMLGGMFGGVSRRRAARPGSARRGAARSLARSLPPRRTWRGSARHSPARPFSRPPADPRPRSTFLARRCSKTWNGTSSRKAPG